LLLKVEGNDVAITALWSTVHGLAHLALDQQLGKMMGKGTIEREKMADNVIETLLCGLSSKPAKQTKIQK
jgi:hypothetical protein